jgi:hypothetical protein
VRPGTGCSSSAIFSRVAPRIRKSAIYSRNSIINAVFEPADCLRKNSASLADSKTASSARRFASMSSLLVHYHYRARALVASLGAIRSFGGADSAFDSAFESAFESAFVSAFVSAFESAFVSAFVSAFESALFPFSFPCLQAVVYADEGVYWQDRMCLGTPVTSGARSTCFSLNLACKLLCILCVDPTS